jgi:2,3-bisphosphoglycerate-independent phosphoglycerate mutase
MKDETMATDNLSINPKELKTEHGGAAMAAAVKELYAAGQTDYSLEPVVLTDAQGKPVGRIEEEDGVVFCCRRGEREIELTEAFTSPDFDHFVRPELGKLDFVILTLYHDKFKDLPVAFAPGHVTSTLAEIASRAGLRQAHIAESEKFAHITFFLNGGNNQPFEGEDDLRIPSPKGVPFEQVPQLSLPEVTEKVIEAIGKKYELIAVNFANGDVIGHTSNNEAKVKCASIVDNNLGKVIEAAKSAGYVTIITADHGNLEEMTNPDGSPHVAHTTNLVPFILVDPAWSCTSCLRDGKLADLAPTILEALGIQKPALMDGETLAPGYPWNGKRRVLLLILDGWGMGKKDDSNPIFLAKGPVWNDLIENYPLCQLQAAGEAVGLQAGKAGNSEAGHMNIGAGRVILQDDVRLDKAMEDGSFYTNDVFLRTINEVKKRGSSLHLIGLLTEKSSHGSIRYPLALLKMAKEAGLNNVFMHLIFDGRSTLPGSAPELLDKLEKEMDKIGIGQIASGTGRGIALDRDGNYGKIKRAFEAMVLGEGKKYPLNQGE